MRRGESILIHAGSGGVGQAAINICLYYECEIFTTVGTPEKREFIRKTFPQVNSSNMSHMLPSLEFMGSVFYSGT